MNIEELKKENTELKEKLKNINEIVVLQNRSSSMGNMIDSIAHQWRQPLMEMSSLFMMIEANAKKNKSINVNELFKNIKTLNSLTQYMSETIDDFRTFLSKDKKKEKFYISQSINDAINLINSSIQKHNIKVDILLKNNTMIKGIKNEFFQVLINIITNAKDILVERSISNPKIKITIKESGLFSIVNIEDNAGGILVSPPKKIFEPFFTKSKKNGSGIGLFLSKLIIEEHMKGKISVENTEFGAKFTIQIKKITQ